MALNLLEEKMLALNAVPKNKIDEEYFRIITSFKSEISDVKVIGDSEGTDKFFMFFKAFGEKYMFVSGIQLGNDTYTQFERVNSKLSYKVLFSIPSGRDAIAPFLFSVCNIDL